MLPLKVPVCKPVHGPPPVAPFCTKAAQRWAVLEYACATCQFKVTGADGDGLRAERELNERLSEGWGWPGRSIH